MQPSNENPRSRRTLLRDIELLVVLELFAVVSYLLIQLKIVRVDQQFGDTAQLSEIIDSLITRGWAANQIMPNLISFLNSGITTMHAAQVAQNPLLPPVIYEQNHLQFHAYLVIYPLAALARHFPTIDVLLATYVLSFTSAIVIVYFALRRAQVSILASAAFSALVMFHPAWSEGLRGQFYPDRIFIVSGLILMFVSSSATIRRVALVAAAAFCLSIDERGAITAGLFLLAYAVLYWTKPNTDRWFKLALAGGLLFYGIIAVKWFLPLNIYDSGFIPSNVGILIQRFSGTEFRNAAILFLIVNGALWILAWFEWRAALIALFLMLPNIVGNIGGAEKLGWGTHYHDEYLAALIWAAAMGFIRLYRMAVTLPMKSAMYAGVAALIAFLAIIDPSTGTFSTANINNAFVFWFPREAEAFTGPAGITFSQWSRDLSGAVPKNTVVSTIEAGMTPLYSGRTLRLFPIDIDKADYAVLLRAGAPGTAPVYSGVINYLGPDETAKANALIVARMKRDGYDFEHPVFVAPNGVTVLKRVH